MPPAAVTIRTAELSDFDDWFRLYEAVAAEERWIAGEAPCDREDRRRGFESYLADENSVTFLAEADGTVVGMLGVQVRHGIADLGMAVDARWRGHGVGSALLDACLRWATEHGAHKVVLTVWPHNTAARALYRKYGFTDEAVLRRHYRRRNGQLWDAIGMGLVLDDDAPGCPYPAD